jgi:hypothetical protein
VVESDGVAPVSDLHSITSPFSRNLKMDEWGSSYTLRLSDCCVRLELGPEYFH